VAAAHVAKFLRNLVLRERVSEKLAYVFALAVCAAPRMGRRREAFLFFLRAEVEELRSGAVG
jgi:hypothetical protein